MPIKIGNVELENPVIIAPMAGISTIAFRKIAKEFGAGLVCNEMVSDKALFYDSKKTLKMLDVDENEHPVSFQIFGHDIDTVVYAAKFLDTQTNCDIIDFNMGCPVNKVIKAKAGSYLMKDIEYAKELVSNIVKNVSKPVTVKMRLGYDVDHINCVEMAKAMHTKCATVDEDVGNLSGGNMQKVLLGKWLFAEPDILILDEPTRGIDVGAKYEIYCIINQMVAEGKSVIIISSEMPEILGMCDRIYVMNEGSMVAEMPAAEATQEKIMAAILKSDK